MKHDKMLQTTLVQCKTKMNIHHPRDQGSYITVDIYPHLFHIFLPNMVGRKNLKCTKTDRERHFDKI